MPKSINPASGLLNYEFNFTTEAEFLESIRILSSLDHERSPSQRSEVLLRLKELIFEAREELAELIHIETGKLKVECLAEVDRGLITLQVSAEEAKRIGGESSDFFQHTDNTQLKWSITKRFPLGTIFCVTPFNFPLNLALHKIAPAFACGNSILYKPSDFNYKFGRKLVELCYQAGMYKSEIQFCLPDVATLNEHISHSGIDVISFTGGTKTADRIAAVAGRKKLLFELGGNGAFVVCQSADLALVKKNLINARLGVNGQTCTSSKRIFIHEDHYEKIRNFLIKELETIDARPLISEQAAISVESIVQRAIEAGATLSYGHKREKAFYSPTVIENIPNDCDLIREETFGPVFSLIKFTSEDEFISMVNNNPYGLQAGVFTQDLEQAKRAFMALEVGSVGINMPPGFRQEQHPFGGVKASGMGREGIKYAINEMTYIKQMVL